MKWLRYTTIPIGIFMLVLSLYVPKVQASTPDEISDTADWYVQYYDISTSTFTLSNLQHISFISLHSTGSTADAGANRYMNRSNITNALGGILEFNNSSNGEFNLSAQYGRIGIWTRKTSVYYALNISTVAQAQTVELTLPITTPTDITAYDNILWNDDQWVDSNGVLTAQSNYYVSYLLDVNALSSYDIIANNNPNFGNLAPNVTHIWYYDSNYALIGSYNAYSDFGVNTPDLSLNAYYIRIGAPVTNLGGYEPNEIKSTYISTTNRTLKYLDHTGNVVYQTSEVFVGDSTATYDALAEANLPTREGYVFASWSGLTAVGNEPITTKEPIYNQLAQYVVTFLDYDGTFISSGLVYQGQSAPLPTAPTRQHYIFSHWEPPVADVQGNITTYAQYTPVEYQVTWKAPDGSTLKIEMVAYSGLAQAPSYTPTSGLVLDGWLDQDDVTQTVKQSPILVDGQDKIFTATTSIAPEPEPENPNLPPEDYNPITDLLGGVMGASVGAIMTLGTINLFGIYLYQLIFLFIGTTLTLWILKAVRG